MNKCVGLFVSACMKENIHCIPLAYCTLHSLDIFNLILIVLRPRLTGVLFDLILKFRAALTLSLHHFFTLLRLLSFPVLPSFAILSVQLVFIYTLMWESASLCMSV